MKALNKIRPMKYSHVNWNLSFVCVVSNMIEFDVHGDWIRIELSFVGVESHFQSESDDTELRTRFALFVWPVVFPRKMTLFLSVSWIFTSYNKSGRCIRLVRFCQIKTARFSVVLGWKLNKIKITSIWNKSEYQMFTWNIE